MFRGSQGASNPDEFFARYLFLSAERCEQARPFFLSLGAGNCDTEVRVAGLLRQQGLREFEIHCLDLSAEMLARGESLARAEGVAGHIRTIAADLNHWQPTARYCAVMANQSLHHMLELERVFDLVRAILLAEGLFVICDAIGRNGHQRWPEAMAIVQSFWRELSWRYRWNLQLRRFEPSFLDWDCSIAGFEGIRAHDILPLLVERFHFHAFLGYANAVAPFIDRSFGHHFSAERDWDRQFVDRVQHVDEAAIRSGVLTPTQMMAVLGRAPVVAACFPLGRSPAQSIRRADASMLPPEHWRNRGRKLLSRLRRGLLSVPRP